MKPVIFENKTLETIKDFPDKARQRTGYELDRVQRNLDPENWKPFNTVGKGVRVQVGTQYRIMIVSKFDNAIHVYTPSKRKRKRHVNQILILLNLPTKNY